MGLKRWVKHTAGGGGGSVLDTGVAFIELMPPFAAASSQVVGEYVYGFTVPTAIDAYNLTHPGTQALPDSATNLRLIEFSMFPTLKAAYFEGVIYTSGSNGEHNYVVLRNVTASSNITQLDYTSAGASITVRVKSADIHTLLPVVDTDVTLFGYSTSGGAVRLLGARLKLYW